jgi:hypothetical protein
MIIIAFHRIMNDYYDGCFGSRWRRKEVLEEDGSSFHFIWSEVGAPCSLSIPTTAKREALWIPDGHHDDRRYHHLQYYFVVFFEEMLFCGG